MQHGLIPAHVTLCREDELTDLPAIRARLRNGTQAPLTLAFGKAEPFSSHGVLLQCVEGQGALQELRKYVLASDEVRVQQAHITLAHPRNPQAIPDALARAYTLPERLTFVLPEIRLIEQQDGGRWQTLESFPLQWQALSI
ncbi:hypothetical protein GCM10027277_55600 [Pseudoduganella ginsengisoli]